MHNPPHPGEFITDVYLKPNNLSGRELAAKLGVAASTLHRILIGKSGVSPEMAVATIESARAVTGELAGSAIQLRLISGEAACESKRRGKSPAKRSLRGMGTGSGLRFCESQLGCPFTAFAKSQA
jgi:addiction module HigA family antidote